jgi:hypothetical protein
VEAKTTLIMAGLRGMNGEFDEARAMHGESVAALAELGLRVSVATARQISGMVELLADAPDKAVTEYRAGYEELCQMEQWGFVPAAAAFLARALLASDPDANIESLIAAIERAERDDLLAHADAQLLRGRLLARAGEERDAGVTEVEAAVAAYSATDEVKTVADVLSDAAEVLAQAGHAPRARERLEEARRLYAVKGVRPAHARCEARLEQLSGFSTDGPPPALRL